MSLPLAPLSVTEVSHGRLLRVEVFKNNKPLYACETPAETLVMGRQQKDSGEQGPPAQYVQGGVRRLIVAPWEEQEVCADMPKCGR